MRTKHANYGELSQQSTEFTEEPAGMVTAGASMSSITQFSVAWRVMAGDEL